MKKCLPLLMPELSAVKSTIERNEARCDAFELWLDYLKPLEMKDLKGVVGSTNRELLLLFRRQQLEPSKTPMEVRKRCIDTLQGSHLIWDFDINVQGDELQYFRGKQRTSPLLCSYHNYSRTPSDDELKVIAEKMEAFSPAIVKFACLAESNRDALRLLKFLLALTEAGKDAIVLGMGQKGMITRVFGRQFGNAYMFLHLDGEEQVVATAPGQLTLDAFEAVENILETVSSDGRK